MSVVMNMGTINFLSKEQADILIALGFNCVNQRINDTQIVYSFVDSPKLREIISNKFAKNEYYISKTVCL